MIEGAWMDTRVVVDTEQVKHGGEDHKDKDR
jgi:hypothetical protein